jgi:hypothetical protein
MGWGAKGDGGRWQLELGSKARGVSKNNNGARDRPEWDRLEPLPLELVQLRPMENHFHRYILSCPTPNSCSPSLPRPHHLQRQTLQPALGRNCMTAPSTRGSALSEELE